MTILALSREIIRAESHCKEALCSLLFKSYVTLIQAQTSDDSGLGDLLGIALHCLDPVQ